MKILSQKRRDELNLPECFGTCVGGTECWDTCGDHGETMYIKCLMQTKALVDSAIEGELFGLHEIMQNNPIFQTSEKTGEKNGL